MNFLTARKCVVPMQYFQELFISYQRSSVPIFTLVDLKSVISELIKDSAPRLTGPESGHVGCQVNSRRLENTQLLMMFEDLYLILEGCGLLNKKYRGQYGHWTKGISNPGVTQLLRFFKLVSKSAQLALQRKGYHYLQAWYSRRVTNGYLIVCERSNGITTTNQCGGYERYRG